MDELKNQGLEVNEVNERKIREGLREKYGMAAMAIKSLPKIKEILATSDHVLVESLYSWEEYLILQEEFGDNFKILAVYSSPATRYARLQHRPTRPLTAAEARSRDYSQIANLHQAGPIAIADYTVINEGAMKELYEQIEKIVNKLNLWFFRLRRISLWLKILDLRLRIKCQCLQSKICDLKFFKEACLESVFFYS